MHRLLEILLGLPRGFLSREGEFSIQFAPHWPGQAVVGAFTWNLVLVAAVAALLFYVYRREGRSRRVRLFLGGVRAVLLGLLLLLLNRPVVTLSQSRTEPSVLAILFDDSLSMRMRDSGASAENPQSRLESAVNLFQDANGSLLKSLAKKHSLRLYRFDSDAQPLAAMDATGTGLASTDAALRGLTAQANSTQVIPSLLSVMQDMQGQRLAGVVVLTDGRDVPGRSVADGLDALKNFGVKIFPVPLGSDAAAKNIEVQSAVAEETAFKGDIVNVKAMVRATGYEAGHPVRVILRNAKTGAELPGIDGTPAEKTVNLDPDKPTEVELQWKADEVGTKDLLVEAARQPGEIDEDDNSRTVQVSVLDARISVLYVDGYPRWEYRYLKNELLRDKSMDLSCLLTSADADFAQEGNKPIRHFPQSIEELMDYDVVVFGDVDPRYFTDTQLQLVSEFVSRKGGGFAMVAGPKWSPAAFRGTAIEPLLPVSIAHAEASDAEANITASFRPVLTDLGAESGIFRFFADRNQNTNYLKNDIQPVFWYCRGVTVKPGVGETYAEHPTDVGPDNHKAPILVLGRFGAGRTLFSAIDDSWRWRFYTGESVFDTYWVQQLRYLARSRKIGQRRLTLQAGRAVYDLGAQARVTLRILDPILLQQLPDQISVQQIDAGNRVVGQQALRRQDGQSDLYVGSFTADRVGKFMLRLAPIAGSADMIEAPLEVSLPKLELADPSVDRTQLGRLASETQGQTIPLAQAATGLLKIPSAAQVIPIISGQPLWGSPVVMAILVGLIVLEWVARKMVGMV